MNVTITVRYHEDQYTKNKRMFWIPSHGLFLTCTESSFLFCTLTKKISGCLFVKRKYLTWKGNPLFMAENFPLSQVPCLKSTVLATLAFPSPSQLLPCNRAFILHQDDINKPDTSVGHSKKSFPNIKQFKYIFCQSWPSEYQILLFKLLRTPSPI
jgi:hypothetical protein